MIAPANSVSASFAAAVHAIVAFELILQTVSAHIHKEQRTAPADVEMLCTLIVGIAPHARINTRTPLAQVQFQCHNGVVVGCKLDDLKAFVSLVDTVPQARQYVKLCCPVHQMALPLAQYGLLGDAAGVYPQ